MPTKLQRIYSKISRAAELIKAAERVTAFTGAGVSVESGIPPFRGKDGLWNKYDPVFLEINHFNSYPYESWKLIKEIFYDFFGLANPNRAHYGLAEMEKDKFLDSIITQNIDNLHQRAGSKVIHEFHGNSRNLVCVACGRRFSVKEVGLDKLPPKCKDCGGVLKPDFVFFGEPIPEHVAIESYRETEMSDVFILIGTTGEIMPASGIPFIAKSNGAKIVEINIEKSNYTSQITDVFLKGKATLIMDNLVKVLRG